MVLGQPLLCRPDGAIDPHVFIDRRGDDATPHLLWKDDSNARGARTTIFLQRLRADGLGLEGAPKPLLSNDPAGWEGPLVEVSSLVLDVFISAASRLHLDCISTASRLHLGCISAASRLHLDYISTTSRLHLACRLPGLCSTPRACRTTTSSSTLPTPSMGPSTQSAALEAEDAFLYCNTAASTREDTHSAVSDRFALRLHSLYLCRSFSHSALNTLHNTVLPPSCWCI